MAFNEPSNYSSVQFLNELIKAFPFPIECIQADNSLEFIKTFDKRNKGNFQLFEMNLKELKIKHNLIRPCSELALHISQHNNVIIIILDNIQVRYGIRFNKHKFAPLRNSFLNQLTAYKANSSNSPFRPHTDCVHIHIVASLHVEKTSIDPEFK